MRAAVLRELGKPLTIEEIELEAPHAGEVRLRIAASGVCGSDLANAKGILRTPLPAVLGPPSRGARARGGG
jgi:Zn-dependent alcohol dehydrogenase